MQRNVTIGISRPTNNTLKWESGPEKRHTINLHQFFAIFIHLRLTCLVYRFVVLVAAKATTKAKAYESKIQVLAAAGETWRLYLHRWRKCNINNAVKNTQKQASAVFILQNLQAIASDYHTSLSKHGNVVFYLDFVVLCYILRTRFSHALSTLNETVHLRRAWNSISAAKLLVNVYYWHCL